MEKGKVFVVRGISEEGNFNISFRTTIACNKMQACLRLERLVGKIIKIEKILVNPTSMLGKKLIEL